jgi:hypothetical protein
MSSEVTPLRCLPGRAGEIFRAIPCALVADFRFPFLSASIGVHRRLIPSQRARLIRAPSRESFSSIRS